MAKQVSTARLAGWFAAAATVIFVAACSGPSMIGGADVAYVPASVVSPVGYSQSQLDATHYTVKAAGLSATPPAHVERIAQARAAEIGVENKLRWFKVTSVTHGIRCVERREGYKAPASAANFYPTVALEVSYDNGVVPPDASWQASAGAFEQAKAALAAPSADPPVTIDSVKARCGTHS